MEKSITLDTDNESFTCCFMPGTPRVRFNGDYREMAENMLDIRNKFIQEPEQFASCANCSYLCANYFPLKPKKWHINYFPNATCNYDCQYCFFSGRQKERYPDGLPLGNIIQAAKNSGLLTENYGVWMANGEPTIQKYSPGNFDGFDGFWLEVGTNGSVFEQQLYDMMNERDIRISISLDAGTPETYAKIKGSRLWDRVIENIKRYGKARIGIVHLKYIFMPGVNDNEDDVDGFVNVCVENNIPIALCTFNIMSDSDLPERTVEMVKRLFKRLFDAGILCVPSVMYVSFKVKKIMEEITKSLLDER